MYDFKDIHHLDLESSSLCNASCAICNRRHSGGVKVPEMVETYVTFEQFKRWFTVDFIKKLNGLSMCGNYGDTMTNPELLDILRYVRGLNPLVRITMNTNASGRTPEFWQELSNIIGDHGHVTFSVDGLEDTNWIYRRGTHWDKIMMAFTNFKKGPAKARWEFIVFKHNQHQVEEARELSKKLGIEEFWPKKAFGFTEDGASGRTTPYFSVFGENDKHLYDIEAPDEDVENPNRYLLKFENLNKKDGEGYVRHPYTHVDRPLTEWEIKLGRTEIDCQVVRGKGVFVTSEGLVFPCCMTASKLYAPDTADSIQLKNFIADIGKDRINLKNHSLEDIISSDVFQVKWVENFNDYNVLNKRLRVCSMFCGKETNKAWDDVKTSMNSEV